MTVYTNIKTGSKIKASGVVTEGVRQPGVYYKKSKKNGEWTSGSWYMSLENLKKGWVAAE